ncbi:LysR family transcriptional regulator [Nocardia wallacei]|uniref:LysR family transcriptional regulator n=1 Tax=Nocardia wallacei TaxID=480035 RepID=UPI003CC7DA61
MRACGVPVHFRVRRKAGSCCWLSRWEEAVEIESLRWVVTLSEELHFGRASQLHYVSAGHFGRQIQRLERQLGVRLFDRTSRRVTLTPAGQRVVVHARRVLATLEELRNSAEPTSPPASDDSATAEASSPDPDPSGRPAA